MTAGLRTEMLGGLLQRCRSVKAVRLVLWWGDEMGNVDVAKLKREFDLSVALGGGTARRFNADPFAALSQAYIRTVQLMLRVAPGDRLGSPASVGQCALAWAGPVDTRIGRGADSSYATCMTDGYVSLEDLPWADEQVIRAHAAELITMAESLGLTNVRYASGNRLVVTMTGRIERMGPFTFAEEASFHLGYRIRVYTDGVFKNPGVNPDLVAATPL